MRNAPRVQIQGLYLTVALLFRCFLASCFGGGQSKATGQRSIRFPGVDSWDGGAARPDKDPFQIAEGR